jgi:hypothetical protein
MNVFTAIFAAGVFGLSYGLGAYGTDLPGATAATVIGLACLWVVVMIVAYRMFVAWDRGGPAGESDGLNKSPASD